MYVQSHQAEQIDDEDTELVETMTRATQSSDRLGITAQEILDELPAARAEVLQRAYGAAFLEKLERQFKAAHRASSVQHAREDLLRHQNDLPSVVVAALHAQPDRVLSTSTDH